MDPDSRNRAVVSERGDARLLFDCVVVGRMLEHDRPRASERLVDAVGDGLTRVLLTTLSSSESAKRSARRSTAA